MHREETAYAAIATPEDKLDSRCAALECCYRQDAPPGAVSDCLS
jgi:hypothetical protein